MSRHQQYTGSSVRIDAPFTPMSSLLWVNSGLENAISRLGTLERSLSIFADGFVGSPSKDSEELLNEPDAPPGSTSTQQLIARLKRAIDSVEHQVSRYGGQT